ncbi:Aste57867_21308 [Aphanomyces stellatus]|uniref:Aste57867_21308 protein n=1 Tax=Aphanomyces stellatus TaxID=120398 RepID=A0A485LIL3_9STRA|nr:hypothetical protein As57867_021239 [Aphanomyces stellatus]VFT97980.1 Aste57867_21308 [Aphanomyces stellatus]
MDPSAAAPTAGASINDDSWVSKSNWVRTTSVVGDEKGSADKLSLRYLDEFVGALTCSAQMLEWGLFPDAKEVSETMGVFNAIRKLGLQHKTRDPAPGLRDGIVVVGDGITRTFVSLVEHQHPLARTAAMFAYRTKGWTCYSVDPIMQVSSETKPMPWDAMTNVVAIDQKIEDIRIRLDRAIVVLVHAHVTLEQAMLAIDAKSVVAVLTLPCCNWYGRQERLFDRYPDLVYDDLSILSTHREVLFLRQQIRLWYGPSVAPPSSRQPLVPGGCVPKHYVAPVTKQSSVDRFLSTLLDVSVPLGDIALTALAHHCHERFDATSQIVIVGDHPPLVHALDGAGFSSIRSIASVSDAAAMAAADVVLDCGHLHHALNRTEKTKAGTLVGELCLFWQSKLTSSPDAAVVLLSSRRVLRSAKFLTRPVLAWKVEATGGTPEFIYHCTKPTVVDDPTTMKCPASTPLDMPTMDALQSSLGMQFSSRQDGDNGVQRARGTVVRMQTLHANLSFVDLQDDDNPKVALVLFRAAALVQTPWPLPAALMHHLCQGDVLEVVGAMEVTKTGSQVLVASHVRVMQWASRDTLVYYNY